MRQRRFRITSEPTNFFTISTRGVWLSLLGLVFGALLAPTGRWLGQLFCPAADNAICWLTPQAAYRISLLLLLVMVLVVLLLLKIERPFLIILPSLLIFWRLDQAQVLWQGLAYVLAGILVFSLLVWISQVRNWRLAFLLVSLVTILMLII